jgi:hypothetical protein
VEDLAIPDTSNGADELDQYLAQPIERTKVNPIQFWWDRRTTWPGLSRMALDYLSIPGMRNIFCSPWFLNPVSSQQRLLHPNGSFRKAGIFWCLRVIVSPGIQFARCCALADGADGTLFALKMLCRPLRR